MATYQNKQNRVHTRGSLILAIAHYLPLILVLVGVTFIGAHYLHPSSANGEVINSSGRIVDQKGRAVPGVVIVHCQGGTATTNGSGVFTFRVTTNLTGGNVPLDCFRPQTWPAGYSKPIASNSRYSQPTYEWQAAGLNCYLNTANCGPGKGYQTPNETVFYDINGNWNTDTGYNFTATYTDTVPPSTPTLNGNAVSTSQINLSWSSSSDNWSGISGYNLYRNGALRTTQAGNSFSDTGLLPGTTYTYYIVAKDGSNNPSKPSNSVAIKTISVSNPSNPSNPSKPSSGGGSRPSTGSGGSTGTPVTPDTTPPTPPGNLVASSDDQYKTVKLSWDASTDNVGISGYSIDRSSDQQTWTSVSEATTDTNYEDNSVAFSSTVYYRVRAFDAAGNTSEYTSAQVTTSDFSPNAHKDQDSSIDSEDGVVSVQIPSGAVQEDVFCGVQVINNVLSPDIDNYQLASGPYEVSCRKQDGTVLTSFDKSLSVNVKLGSNQLKKAGKLAYYGQKDGNWESLKITKHDKKAKTDSVDLNGHQIFTIMKQHKKRSVFIIIIEVLFFLALLVGGAIFVLRYLQQRKLKGQYDDYLHKSRGY